MTEQRDDRPISYNFVSIGEATNTHIQQGTSDSQQNATISSPDLSKVLQSIQSQPTQAGQGPTDLPGDIAQALAKTCSRTAPLAECFAGAMRIALRLNDQEFVDWCAHELGGWGPEDAGEVAPDFRILNGYLSAERINTRHPYWNLHNIFVHMQNTSDVFIPYRLFVGEPISIVENSCPSKEQDGGLMVTERILGDLMPNTDYGEATVYYYINPLEYRHLVERIRSRLIRFLTERQQAAQ